MPNHSSILLVEDDPRDVELIRRAFKQARMANPIKVVNDGADARDYLSGAGVYADRTQYPVPFLVLLDLNLPRVSGLDVLEWIRKQAGLEELRVVILTSSRDAPDMERAYALGANSYLNKPGNFEQPVMLASDQPVAKATGVLKMQGELLDFPRDRLVLQRRWANQAGRLIIV